MAYLISIQQIRKGLDPNIHVIDSIYDIKGKLTLQIIVANYINQCVTLNKGQCIGYMGPSLKNVPQTYINSIMTEKMMDEQVHLNTFKTPLHNLSQEIKWSPHNLLETVKSQFP